MFYLVANWNFSIPDCKAFNSFDDLNNYAKENNILISEVDDNSFHCRKYSLSRDSKIYVGW